jgi:hypothetical protein
MSVESHKTAMPAKPDEDNWQSSTESDDHAWAAPVSAIDSSWSAPVQVPLIAAHEVGAHADSTWDPGIHTSSAAAPAGIDEAAAPAAPVEPVEPVEIGEHNDRRRAMAERAATVDLGVEDIEIQSARAALGMHAGLPARPARMNTIRDHGRDPTVVVVPLPSPAAATGGHPALEPRPFSARFAPRPPRRRWVTLGVVAAIAGAIAFVAPRLSSPPPMIGPSAITTRTAPPPAPVATAAAPASPPPATPARTGSAADRRAKAASQGATKPATTPASAAANPRSKPAAKASRPPATTKPGVKPAASKASPAKPKPTAAKANAAKPTAAKASAAKANAAKANAAKPASPTATKAVAP